MEFTVSDLKLFLSWYLRFNIQSFVLNTKKYVIYESCISRCKQAQVEAKEYIPHFRTFEVGSRIGKKGFTMASIIDRLSIGTGDPQDLISC